MGLRAQGAGSINSGSVWAARAPLILGADVLLAASVHRTNVCLWLVGFLDVLLLCAELSQMQLHYPSARRARKTQIVRAKAAIVTVVVSELWGSALIVDQVPL